MSVADKVISMRRRTAAELAFDSCLSNKGEVLPSVVAAREDFLSKGLPNRRVESWKYTDLRGFLQHSYPPLPASDMGSSDISLKETSSFRHALDCACLVFVNGILHLDLSDISGIESHIEVSRFDGLGSVFDFKPLTPPAPDTDSVMSLNLGLADRGMFLRVSGDVPRAIECLHIHSGSGSGIFSRNTIVLAPECRVVVLESHISSPFPVSSPLPSEGHAHIGMSDIYLGGDASLEHVILQSRADMGAHIWNYNYALGKNARLTHCGLGCGSGLSRHQLYVRYDGMGSDARISGGCHVSGSRHHDMTLIADHLVGGCSGRELFKGVVDDSACAVFQGKIIVRPDAQKTDSQQSSHALLLGDGCEFKTKPELEIYADDVVCGHGATSGRLDRDMIFYLCSRGISESDARSLLVCAFLNEIFSDIGCEEVRSYLESFVSSRISSLTALEAA